MTRLEALADFAALLREECLAYEALVESARDHRRCLIAGPGEEFDASLQRTLAAMERCNELSRRRLERTRALSAELHLGEPCSTGRLLASLPAGESEALLTPYQELRELTTALAAENEQNRSLAEHRLDLLQGDYLCLQNLALKAVGREAEAGPHGQGSILSYRA